MSQRVQITMDEADFRLLIQNSAQWAHQGWERQLGRFEIQGAPETGPALTWKMAYWVGTEYAAVILARSFTASRGYESQTAVDLASDGEWVILTDYDTWNADR